MEKTVFFGRANESSDVGIMIAHGHHSQLLHYGSEYQLPADRHCEGCGAACGSADSKTICPKAEMVHIDIHREETNKIVEQLAGSGNLKKVKRLFKRSIERNTSRAVDERLKELDKLVKEKPRYCPQWLWTRIKGMVLRDRIEV